MSEPICERCAEPYDPDTSCTHGRELCPVHALAGCQECQTEEADAAARTWERHDEYWEAS